MIESNLFVGMLSGTSRDGVDTALVQFSSTGRPEVLAALCLPYPDDLKQALEEMIAPGLRPDSEAMQVLDVRLADFFSLAALHLLDQAGVAPAGVRAIGSHGQTVWHDPENDPPESIQLGDPALIATRTGITTVGYFRQADVEAGGQGAPLAPLLHSALFRPETGRRAIVNLGGISNVSFVSADGEVSGFDTGPANCLMDGWIREHQSLEFDRDGAWAGSGTVSEPLLNGMLGDEYFQRAPPKSTGVEYFNSQWLLQWLEAIPDARSLSARDVQATLCELTARSLAVVLMRNHETNGLADVLLCGGGAHNGFLRGRIEALTGLNVRLTGACGLDPDWVEAVLFAWLARARLANQAQDTTRITGANQPVRLGQVCNPAR